MGRNIYRLMRSFYEWKEDLQIYDEKTDIMLKKHIYTIPEKL